MSKFDNWVSSGLLNPDLDITTLKRELASEGYIQIANGLKEDAAEALHDCLKNQLTWSVAYRDNVGAKRILRPELAAMESNERDQFWLNMDAIAQEGYQFNYDTYMAVSAYLNNQDTDLPLNSMVRFCNSSSWLAFWRVVTGDKDICKTYLQATRYIAGSYLKEHNDFVRDEHRRYALVINLSKNWRADWGGLVQFIDGDGGIVRTLMPTFNSITVFKVPVAHCVSPVASYVSEERLALTGWLRAD